MNFESAFFRVDFQSPASLIASSTDACGSPPVATPSMIWFAALRPFELPGAGSSGAGFGGSVVPFSAAFSVPALSGSSTTAASTAFAAASSLAPPPLVGPSSTDGLLPGAASFGPGCSFGVPPSVGDAGFGVGVSWVPPAVPVVPAAGSVAVVVVESEAPVPPPPPPTDVSVGPPFVPATAFAAAAFASRAFLTLPARNRPLFWIAPPIAVARWRRASAWVILPSDSAIEMSAMPIRNVALPHTRPA